MDGRGTALQKPLGINVGYSIEPSLYALPFSHQFCLNMQQKVVIVTGGADGFGAAIADRFSQEAYKVIILDLNKDKGELKASGDTNILFLLGDVTRPETWERALAVAREKLGRVDVVVNNAGWFLYVLCFS